MFLAALSVSSAKFLYTRGDPWPYSNRKYFWDLRIHANSFKVAVVVLTVPLWIFGKKIRSAIARNDALTRFMKDD
jgi:hypothetical protein